MEKSTNEEVCHATARVCNLLSKGVANGQHDSSCGLRVCSLLSMLDKDLFSCLSVIPAVGLPSSFFLLLISLNVPDIYVTVQTVCLYVSLCICKCMCKWK